MICTNGYEVKVLLANGFYIGTLDEDGLPMCRVSADYYKTKTEAQKALNENSFTRRNCVENNLCSNGKPCF